MDELLVLIIGMAGGAVLWIAIDRWCLPPPQRLHRSHRTIGNTRWWF